MAANNVVFMDASLLEPIFACWPAIGRESYQLAGTGESWAKRERYRPSGGRAAGFFEKRRISEQDWAAGRNYSPWQSHLRDANAMIAG
jgi:hypothetical protein